MEKSREHRSLTVQLSIDTAYTGQVSIMHRRPAAWKSNSSLNTASRLLAFPNLGSSEACCVSKREERNQREITAGQHKTGL
jgi:hypothetical protein